ncbi:Kae1/TsaD family protein [Kipferlia bialata]|uniref:N(6)-L-threonylcarbamoyladenine synthase n=1 Tax=Kipferlia bialata TaxID=797122 RepID=A0A9K3GJ09_9EUKA|nr:Kae1/TsaD family protein [Kipferlia bialata]|eukprot:g5577.t1
MIALGIEGSANKLGIGIVTETGEVLANVRDTYVAPMGEGFMPRETAEHHRQLVIPLVKKALAEAKLTPADITIVCYTRGPGIGAPLQLPLF